MKPFVGLPVAYENTKCSHSADLDMPPCGSDATVHLAVRSEAWGVVGLLTCVAHEATARATGEVIGEHVARDECRFLTGECWP